jgi:hypothetical protein
MSGLLYFYFYSSRYERMLGTREARTWMAPTISATLQRLNAARWVA